MSKKIETTTKSEQISIRLSEILVPDDGNIRSDLPRIKELAADLALKGQITPIVVSNGGPPGKPYVLRAGHRRHAAFVMNAESIAGWKDKEILAVVRHYAEGDHLGPIVDGYTENTREAVHPLDIAECFHRLVTGTYPVPSGEMATPVDRETICSRFNVSSGHVGKLLKVFKNMDPDVAREARKKDAPLRLLIAMSAITGEGEDDAAREEDRAKQQGAVLKAWVAQQEALESEGRTRGVRSDKGTKKSAAAEEEEGGEGEDAEEPSESDDEPKGNIVLKPTRRIGPTDKTYHRSAGDYLRVLNRKKKVAKKEERSRLEGMIQVIQFLMGKRKALPEGLSAEDFEEPEAE